MVFGATLLMSLGGCAAPGDDESADDEDAAEEVSDALVAGESPDPGAQHFFNGVWKAPASTWKNNTFRLVHFTDGRIENKFDRSRNVGCGESLLPNRPDCESVTEHGTWRTTRDTAGHKFVRFAVRNTSGVVRRDRYKYSFFGDGHLTL